MADFSVDWQVWHDAREERLRDPRGWLAITAIHWLTDEPQRFDDVPGEWIGDEAGATVTLGAGEALTLGDAELTEGIHRLGPLDEDGVTVGFGDAVAQVADRDGQPIVRPRHPDSPKVRAYRGTPCYPPEPGWVLDGRFEPYPEADGEAVGEAVGEVIFTYAGAEHRLVAWAEEDESLWILFRDATSGVTTYPANRQVLVEPPAADGSVSIDFNRAINMPCAYTDFATCPLPPAANTLPFAVEAGEQTPTDGPDPGPFFHGTKADLRVGGLLEPGRSSNFGERRTANFVYLTAALDAAIWGAELAAGDGTGRIYRVEPTGLFEDDPNLTDTRFPGNRTRSYRTREALRVVGEVRDWEGHAPEVLQAMRDRLAELSRLGVEAINE